MLCDYHVDNHASNFFGVIMFFAWKLKTKSQRVLSRRKQASRYIFATQTDVKSIITITFRVAILTEDFYVRSYWLVFITGYWSLIEELQKGRLMNILSPHSCETCKQCTRYVFAGFLLTHLISRHSYLVYGVLDCVSRLQRAENICQILLMQLCRRIIGLGSACDVFFTGFTNT